MQKRIIFLSNSHVSLTTWLKCGIMSMLHKLHIFSLIRENTLVKSVFSLFSYRIGESLCSNIRGKHFFGAFLRECTFLYANEENVWVKIFQKRLSILPEQNLRPDSLTFVLETESKVLNVVATNATTICFVFPDLIRKTKKKINILCCRLPYEALT